MYAAVDLVADGVWRVATRRQLTDRLGGDDLWGWVIDADAADGGAGPGGRLAACGLMNRNPRLPIPGQTADARGHIQWVCTDEGYRRRGYARALMDRLIADSDARGIETLELVSSPFARSLYPPLGFVEWPPVEYPPDVRGVPMQRRAKPRSDRGNA